MRFESLPYLLGLESRCRGALFPVGGFCRPLPRGAGSQRDVAMLLEALVLDQPVIGPESFYRGATKFPLARALHLPPRG